jgi:hypothetical protein
MFSRPSEPIMNDTKGMSAHCNVFGSGFLKNKLQRYAELMGITSTKTEGGNSEFNFNKTLMESNLQVLMNELFHDLGINPPSSDPLPVE